MKRFLAIIAVIIIVSLSFFTKNYYESLIQSKPTQALFLPHLKQELASIDSISIQTAKGNCTVVKQDGWVDESSHYPITLESRRKLLLDLSTLTIVDKKTSSAGDHEKLGLLTNNTPPNNQASNAYGDQIILYSHGKPLYHLVIGYAQRNIKHVSGLNYFYIRHHDRQDAFLVKGEINIPSCKDDYFEPINLNVTLDDIKTIDVKSNLVKIGHIDLTNKLTSNSDKTAFASYEQTLSSIPVIAVWDSKPVIKTKTTAEYVSYTTTKQQIVALALTDDGTHYWLTIDDARNPKLHQWFFEISPPTRRQLVDSLYQLKTPL
ncbi:MAG: DUF4340 domain-containing protein [Alphaproteobacteria bacterium]|nr:DUF4340 domain-containing protein [Alphaproteobacteria bacterium]